MGVDFREALRETMQATTASTEAPAVSEAPADTTPAPVADVPEETPAPSSPAEGRDEKGRFVAKGELDTPSAVPAKKAAPKKATTTTSTPPPKAAAAVDGAPVPKPAEATATEAPKPAEATPTPKAPASWRPTVREAWGKLPAEVQAEVARREREVAVALQETAAARKTHDAFAETVRPYLPLIQAEGGDPMKAVGSLLQTAAALRTAPPQHKATLVANLIKTFGVPIDALGAALSGEAPAAQPSHAPAEYRDPRVDSLMASLQAAQQQRMVSEREKAAAEVQSLVGELEFMDVERHGDAAQALRESMADLMDVASRRGVELSLKDAYSRAVALDPEFSAIQKQRDAAKAAETANAATQRTRAASSSVRGSPAPAEKPDTGDWRSAVAAAIAAHRR